MGKRGAKPDQPNKSSSSGTQGGKPAAPPAAAPKAAQKPPQVAPADAAKTTKSASAPTPAPAPLKTQGDKLASAVTDAGKSGGSTSAAAKPAVAATKPAAAAAPSAKTTPTSASPATPVARTTAPTSPPPAVAGWKRDILSPPANGSGSGSFAKSAPPGTKSPAPAPAPESLKTQGDKLTSPPTTLPGKGSSAPAAVTTQAAPRSGGSGATDAGGPPTEKVSGISAAAAVGAAAAPVRTPTTVTGASGRADTPVAAPPAPSAAPAPTPASRADAERAAVAEGKAPAPSPAKPPSDGGGARENLVAARNEIPVQTQWSPPSAQSPAPTTSEPSGDAPSASSESQRQPPFLFECAWEVCWQLGGIYTVLRSKAQAMIDRWGDRYCLIGPYNPHTAAIEFEEQPTYGPIKEAINRLKEMGIPCHFGRWLINGRPRVILIDYRARYGSLGTDKYLMWEDHQIALPSDDGEINEVVAFGFGVSEFFRQLTQIMRDRPILAHFHEWMGGVAVPRIAHLRLPMATVFTTHATLLGRYLAGDNPYFYDHIGFINPDAEAAKYQIYPRFAIERAAAHASTVFTTVSDVTGFEAEKLLGRAPDLITPNGINLHKFAAPHEFQHLHARSKEKINEFVMGHFFPSYTFDLDRTLYVFTSGRYEYRNKGMDMFIEAMHRLNWRLKGVQNPPTIVAFIITRAPTRNINVQVLQNQSMYEDLKHTCNDIQSQMGHRLLGCTARGQLPGFNDLLKEDEQVRLKRAMHAWKTHRQPLIVTHDLADDANDPILRHLRHRNMFNAADDPVKMIFHPEFLSATNPVMAMDYEHFVRGTHMGIFPSYYEPWGYTPLECIALGVPAVTTDLAGFGSYVQKHVYPRERRDADRQGIQIIPRRGRSFDDACDQLVNHMFQFCQLTRRQRIEMRNRTERLSEQFDWSTLAKHYDEAHNVALERMGAPKQGSLEIRMV